MDAHKLLIGVESAIYQPGISLTVSVLSWLTLAGVAPRAVLGEVVARRWVCWDLPKKEC